MHRPTRALVTALALIAALPAASAQARSGVMTSFDGTKIAWNFYPAPGASKDAPAPTVMNGPGYSGSGAKEGDGLPKALAKAGYNVMTWDPRGFGSSEGTVEIDSPAFEGRDAQGLIDVLTQQPEVAVDKPSDPHLGMIGGSYGGGIQNVLAAIDKRVDVITPSISWHSLVTSLNKSDTAKGGWGAALYGTGAQSALLGLQGSGDPQFGRVQDPVATSAIAGGAATGHFTDEHRAFFAARGPGDDLISKIGVPTLITQGTNDTLFTLHEAIENYLGAKKAGVPVHMSWFCGGLTDPSVAHGICTTPQGPQPKLVQEQSIQWLDHYLKGDSSVLLGPRFRWVSDKGVLHYAADYPTAQGAPVTGTGAGTLPIAPGDASGALIAALPSATALNVKLDPVTPGTQLLGEPQLDLTYSGTAADPDGRVYAQLVDDATQQVLGNQTTPVPVQLDGAEHTLSIPMEAIASDAVAGSSYTLQLAGGATQYFAARQPALLTVEQAKVSIPTVAVGASSTDPKDIPAEAAPAPAPTACTKRRSLTFKVSARGGAAVTRVVVRVDGKVVRTVRAKRITKVRVAGLAGGRRHTVRLDTATRRGAARRSTRTVDGCGKSSGLKVRRAR